jgi:S1-C subfamily serine protease
MNGRFWTILGALVATLLVSLAISRLAFPTLWQPTTLKGPIAIMDGHSPKHGFLGVEFQTPTTSTTIPSMPLTIGSVVDGSGAAEAGLRPGDIVVSIGRAQQPDYEALQKQLQLTSPGDEILLTFRRGSTDRQVRVRLASFVELIGVREAAQRSRVAR